MGVLDMRQRIVVGLQIEDRDGAGSIVLLARGAIAGDPLRRQDLRMPAGEPAARIMAGREEGILQRLQSLGVGQRRVGARLDGLAYYRRARRMADIGSDQ